MQSDRLIDREATAGVVEGIYISPAAGEGMQALQEVEAMAGWGLAGDRYLTGKGYYSDRPLTDGGRQLTLVEAEVLEDIREEGGIHLDPSESRRNLITRGVRLNGLIGERFYVGQVLCEGVSPCDPCKYLEEITGKPVLEPLAHRGGLRARILTNGTIKVGNRLHRPYELA